MPRPIEGEFPKYESLNPGRRPLATVALDFDILAELAESMPLGPEGKRVYRLEVFDEKTPVRLTSAPNRDGVTGLGLIMPVTIDR